METEQRWALPNPCQGEYRKEPCSLQLLCDLVAVSFKVLDFDGLYRNEGKLSANGIFAGASLVSSGSCSAGNDYCKLDIRMRPPTLINLQIL